jgi:hypothetical protein
MRTEKTLALLVVSFIYLNILFVESRLSSNINGVYFTFYAMSPFRASHHFETGLLGPGWNA